MPSDAVLAALESAGVPSKDALRSAAASPSASSGWIDLYAILATDLDRIGPVAAVHGGPAAKRAMLRTLLQQWRFENDDQLSIDVEVAVDDILSLLAPEAPTEDDDGR